jgi:hypothetical protein
MFLNPCYESSLHHDDPVLDRKVPKDDTSLFDEFMDDSFNVQTLNLIQSTLPVLNTKPMLVGMSWRLVTISFGC